MKIQKQLRETSHLGISLYKSRSEERSFGRGKKKNLPTGPRVRTYKREPL
jgi:hypothetical protein